MTRGAPLLPLPLPLISPKGLLLLFVLLLLTFEAALGFNKVFVMIFPVVVDDKTEEEIDDEVVVAGKKSFDIVVVVVAVVNGDED